MNNHLLSKQNNGVEFILLLYHDILLEVFQYGNRRQLFMLERIGRRFLHLNELYFWKIPFLHLNLLLEPRSLFLQICDFYKNSMPQYPLFFSSQKAIKLIILLLIEKRNICMLVCKKSFLY